MSKYFSKSRPILEGTRKTLPARFLRGLLVPLGWCTEAYAARKREKYRQGKLKPQQFGVPVISVGNITVGGTGKTPMAAMLAAELITRGYQPGVVSRGYGASDGLNDETMMLRQDLPGIITCSNPDRNAAITEAIAQGADCIIMDDGFQRLSTRRDLDIVLLDATAPFGGGRCLPAGLLREPVTAVRDADILVLTRTEHSNSEKVREIEEKLAELAPGVPIIQAIHQLREILTPSGEEVPPSEFKDLKVAALSSIARPDGFVKTLEMLNAKVLVSCAYPDHYNYAEQDLHKVRVEAEAVGAQAIVTTAKDWVKIRELISPAGLTLPVYVVTIEMGFFWREEKLFNALDRILPAKT
ncbi:MAG: tetraacyldisaccharide 4'-kinase [Planctomycetes bacterium]|nr:tetraacyldisaccharide 4'-kinase [Planctomycetota bacterium]